MIDAAPWRIEVPMQSEPVSPPPITTTCLPLAVIVPLGAARSSLVAGVALVLLRQEIHGEMDAVELAARHFEVARRLGAAGHHHRVEFLEQRGHRDVDADLDLGAEGDAFGLPSARCGGRSAIFPS